MKRGVMWLALLAGVVLVPASGWSAGVAAAGCGWGGEGGAYKPTIPFTAKTGQAYLSGDCSGSWRCGCGGAEAGAPEA